jgi:hypothetical protein
MQVGKPLMTSWSFFVIILAIPKAIGTTLRWKVKEKGFTGPEHPKDWKVQVYTYPT